MLAENKSGWKMIDFFRVSEDELENYSPVTGAYAIIKYKDKFVLGYNKWRKQWELPAGHIEERETAKEAAIRELHEETHQIVDDLTFLGVYMVDSPGKEIRYQAIYYGEIDTLSEFVSNQDDEMQEIVLWNMKDDIGYIDEVDIKVLEIFC